MKTYLESHGILETTAEQLGLTFDADKNRIIIPIKNIEGKFLFNKYRNLSHENDPAIPKFTYDSGSSAQLYNCQAIKNSEYAFVFEGEIDVWKAFEDGIPAVAGTSGAGTFETEWTEQLAGKKTFVCYDNDPAGEEGITKVLKLIPDALRLKLPEDSKDYCEYRKKYSVKDFQKLTKEVIETNTLSYEQFGQVVDKWLLLPDKNVLKVLFASLISHYFTSDPLWIFLVAPPSGTKTELITLLSALPIVYMISSMTDKTLFSGLEGHRKESPSLMMRIPNSIITMKDFTSILSMRQEEKMSILGQLREIYDGRYDRAFGTGGEIHWTGRVTLVAGVTGIIDNQHTLFQTMGERFVMYRVLQPNDEEVAEKALSISGQETEMRQELRMAMRKFFWGIKIPKIGKITIPPEITKTLASLASFIVIARSGIIRNSYGAKEIELIPEPEAPSRLAKQLGVLIKALAVLAGKRLISWEEYYLTLRVALDTVPRNKISHLLALIEREEGTKTSEVATQTGYSLAGAEMILEDLFALKLINKTDWGQGTTPLWHLTEKCLGYWGKILPHNNDTLWQYFPETDFYHSFIEKCLEKAKEGKFVESL